MKSLIAAARDGSQDALDRILANTHLQLLDVARRKLGQDDHVDLEDVLQDTFIESFGAIGRFEGADREAFLQWASRMIDRHVLERTRRARRQQGDDSPARGAARAEARLALAARCLSCSVPEDPPRRAEVIGALLRSVARLPRDQRAVVERHFLRQESYAKIAADVKRPEETVQRVADRALEQLTQAMRRAPRTLGQASAPA